MALPQPIPTGEPLLEVLDDLLPPQLQGDAWQACLGNTWYFGNQSTGERAIPFWKMDLEDAPAIQAIWELVRPRCEAIAGASLRVVRQYANGHTYGLGGQPHHDDDRPGTYTLLYYPMPEWQQHWEGETVFFDGQGDVAMAVQPRPNRAILFDSRIPHAGRAPGRAFTGLRVTVAFKLETAEPAAAPASEGPIQVRETGSEGGVHEFSVRIAAAHVEERVSEQLIAMGQSLRLPGFRPGKVPIDVLRQRYGARTRADVIGRLPVETVMGLLPQGGMLSSVEFLGGADAGDLGLKVTVTYTAELPPVDFSGLALEQLVPEESTPEAEALAGAYLKQQVLDHLAAAYGFPIAPVLVEREFSVIWKAAETQLDIESGDRNELAAELHAIAERRVRLGVVVAETARRHQIRVTEKEAPAHTHSRLLEDKVIAWIVGLAQVRCRRVNLEELRRLCGDS